MRVIGRDLLQVYWRRPGRQSAEQPLKSWLAEAKRAAWKKPADLKAQYRSASFVAGNRVVFNIAGNKHRLVVQLDYRSGIVRVRFIGTHAEYDDVDVKTVGRKRKAK